MQTLTRAALAACASLVLTGCSAIGLEPLEDLRELEEAKYAVPKPLIEETARIEPRPPLGLEGFVVEVAGQHWQATATEYHLPSTFVRQVGTSGPLSFFVFAWDDAPFDRVLARMPAGQYQEFSEIY